jgi:hypothetical protein
MQAAEGSYKITTENTVATLDGEAQSYKYNRLKNLPIEKLSWRLRSIN